VEIFLVNFSESWGKGDLNKLSRFAYDELLYSKHPFPNFANVIENFYQEGNLQVSKFLKKVIHLSCLDAKCGHESYISELLTHILIIFHYKILHWTQN